jgi:hypothetical protein
MNMRCVLMKTAHEVRSWAAEELDFARATWSYVPHKARDRNRGIDNRRIGCHRATTCRFRGT